METNRQMPLVKPQALRVGDAIGVVAPASNIKRELLDKGCDTLRGLGYKPFYLESILDQDLYFAGSVERRARELETMFTREDVRAIVCARGGYGANYLLNVLDPQKIVSNPKIFVGYSDITTLMTCFTDSAGMVTFHGPMVTKDFAREDGVDLASWEAALTGLSQWELDLGTGSGVKGLVEGEAEGILYGGCLSMLAASLGTPHEIRTAATILFIEDVATKPYQVDRMLMQLKLAGKLSGVRGLIFGEMLDCFQTADQGYTLEEVILRIIGNLGVPVAFGLRSGHVSRGNVTLPMGVRAALKVSGKDVSLRFLEAATVASGTRVGAPASLR
ncbi:MAG TPA: LD-carboxypeptidase [Terriglobales bacterium]|nr:LD-carboxypeptidase [Terriglobales bacterium]